MHIKDIQQSIRALKQGKLIVYPTDTLYALGADIFDENAVKKVFSVKKRPLDNPLPVAVASLNQMKNIGEVTTAIKKVVNHFLPGPLTLITKKTSSHFVGSNASKTIAVRIPNHAVALALLHEYGPLTVTSANIHGLPPQSTIIKILHQIGKENIASVIDVGPLESYPSTIVDMTQDPFVILRKGIISKQQIRDAIDDE